MLGPGLQFGRAYADDRFYSAAAARQHFHQRMRPAGGGGAFPSPASRGKAAAVPDSGVPENRAASSRLPAAPPAVPPCNLGQFLESTTPSVPAQYHHEARMRGWRAGDAEYNPYYVLEDLWESFKEWSAYGAGVPLLLDGRDSVVQYYVPYLSGIQLYVASTGRSVSASRGTDEESDGDCFRDSSSDGSSDGELGRGIKYSRDWVQNHLECDSMLRIKRLSIKDQDVALQEGFSSDDSEAGNTQGHLLFEYFERDPPFCREPLADKVFELARHFPELKTLRSCDLLPASWISVAWYPIYRIPTGPTLRDLDACFLTFHSLSTPMEGAGNPCPVMTYPWGVDGVPIISLPVFGLASYKLKGSMWMPNGGYDRQLANSLLQSADNWLRILHVDLPDYRFFASNGACR